MKTYNEEVIFFDREMSPPSKFEETIIFENVYVHPKHQEEIETENWYDEIGQEYHSEILENERADTQKRVSAEMQKRYNTREYAGGSIDWEYSTRIIPGAQG